MPITPRHPRCTFIAEPTAAGSRLIDAVNDGRARRREAGTVGVRVGGTGVRVTLVGGGWMM